MRIKCVTKTLPYRIALEFESSDEEEFFKIANQSAGTRFDVPEEIKTLAKRLYNKYTGEELPDGTYYIPSTNSIMKLRNMLTNQPDFKNNI
jgi:hypothetical protein